MKPQNHFDNHPEANITHGETVVKSYEVGEDETVFHGSLMNYLEEIAVTASQRAGYSNNWVLENGYLWIIRKWYVQYLNPAHYGDKLQIQTWISNFRRVQSHREYMVDRDDGTPILIAKANWVFVEQKTFRPTRFPDDFNSTYGPAGLPQEVVTDIADGTPLNAPTEHFMYRARLYEIDRAHHVNNAHYIRWSEDAAYQYLQTLNIVIELSQIISHEFEYRSGATIDNNVRVSNQCTKIGSSEILITQSFTHQASPDEDATLIATNKLRVVLPTDVIERLQKTHSA